MTVIHVDQGRLAAFSDAIEDTRISTRSSRRRILQVIGEPGCGKTTLAGAYLVNRRESSGCLIGPEWMTPLERDVLDRSTIRRRLTIIDEPLFFPRLSEFLDAPGDVVVLLMQHVDDLPLDVMLPNSLRYYLPHWTQFVRSI
jgi:hypothetical protein